MAVLARRLQFIQEREEEGEEEGRICTMHGYFRVHIYTVCGALIGNVLFSVKEDPL